MFECTITYETVLAVYIDGRQVFMCKRNYNTSCCGIAEVGFFDYTYVGRDLTEDEAQELLLSIRRIISGNSRLNPAPDGPGMGIMVFSQHQPQYKWVYEALVKVGRDYVEQGPPFVNPNTENWLFPLTIYVHPINRDAPVYDPEEEEEEHWDDDEYDDDDGG